MRETLRISELRGFFPPERGWRIVETGDSNLRRVQFGTALRCIDRHFGITESGYDPDSVPLSPAWPGAIDGLASSYEGTLEERMSLAASETERIGFRPAYHGDYVKDIDGCAYRRALIEGRFEGLPPMTREEHQFLAGKMGLHYTQLIRPQEARAPEGFMLNEIDYYTVLPEGGKFYTIDLWFAQRAGIANQQALSLIAKCGELLLPQDNKTLFVVRY